MTEALSLAPRFTAWVALGGNLGDVPQTFRLALRDLANLPGTRVQGVSALYQTAPWQAEGPPFFNAVAALDTPLGAGELMRSLLRIEADHGRARSVVHAPRTLDLDLLAHGNRVSETPELQLPHPRAHERAFVLAPWAELLDRLVPDAGVSGAPALPDAAAIRVLCLAQGAVLHAAAGWHQA